MRISVCIPVYGREAMLEQAIHSVLAQGYSDTELVLQDGNVDKPAEKALSGLFALLGSRLKYNVERDNGIFPAVNMCLRRASGDVLYFACSDDLICPGAFQAVVKAFESERYGGAQWLYGKTISADSTGRTQGVDGEPVSYERLLQGNCIGQPSVFWNREMMELAGVFDPRLRFAADYDLWLRFWKRREPIFVNQELGIFRHHAEQDTEVHSKEVDKAARWVSQRHRNFGDTILRARNKWLEKYAYLDGAPVKPPHHFDLMEYDPE